MLNWYNRTMKEQIEKLIDYLDSTIEINQEIAIEPEYTLVIKPSPDLLSDINHFIEDLSKTDGSPYYYNKENLHSTIYGRIDIKTNTHLLASFLEKELRQINMTFSVGGVSATAIILDPIDFSLFGLRRKMINFLHDEKRLTRNELMEEMAFITTLRLKEEPNRQLLEYLKENRQKQFGIFKPQTIELYRIESKIFDGTQEKIFSINL